MEENLLALFLKSRLIKLKSPQTPPNASSKLKNMNVHFCLTSFHPFLAPGRFVESISVLIEQKWVLTSRQRRQSGQGQSQAFTVSNFSFHPVLSKAPLFHMFIFYCLILSKNVILSILTLNNFNTFCHRGVFGIRNYFEVLLTNGVCL